MNLNRLKTLFLLLIGIAVAITLAIAAGNAILMTGLKSRIDNEHVVNRELIRGLDELKLHVVQIQQYLTDAAATGENDGMDEGRQALAEAKSALKTIVAADSQYGGEVAELEQGAQRLFDTGVKMVAAYKQSQSAGNEFMKSTDGFDAQSDTLQEKIGKISARIVAQQAEAARTVDASIRLNLNLSVGLSVALALVVTALSFITYRRVLRIVGAEPEIGARLTEYLARGELSRGIRLRADDGTSLLARLSQMKGKWTDVITGLRGQSDVLARASADLNAQAHAMSTNGQAQSEAAAGIAASVEQFTVSIEEIAAKARDANANVARTGELSGEAARVIRGIADEVREVATAVQQSASQISELDGSTRGIASVVELIREVADQTNLIALNAAIEAARAGEFGRGFAVVADEVRKLAERTTQSTADISRRIDEVHGAAERIVQTIDQSVRRVEASVSLSREALGAMDAVSGQATEASRQVREIDAALDEQRAGAHQITAAVEGIARMAESNAESARSVSGHSDRIDEIAKTIDAEVAYFKLSQAGRDDDVLS